MVWPDSSESGDKGQSKYPVKINLMGLASALYMEDKGKRGIKDGLGSI